MHVTMYELLENPRTSRDAEKNIVINYVIGNNKKRKIFEKKQDSLEYTET